MTKDAFFSQLGMVIGAVLAVSCEAARTSPQIAWVVIPPGIPLVEVADSLAGNNVVRSARAFVWYARWSGVQDELQPGVYEFPLNLTLAGVAEMMRAGVPPIDTVIIPPGITLAEAAPIFERELGLPTAEFMSAASAVRFQDRLDLRGPTIEGYLLPGLHVVRVGGSAVDILDNVTDAFEAQWTSQWVEQLDSLGLHRDELVTLASIIEGEVRHDEERALVSSVYHNRLAMGMRLQADPTIIYALGERRRLFNRDYEFDSPFNTYLVDGLPPHPINQPSLASIEAALYPQSTDYLYFVAGPDGRHRFSSSYDEHLENIRRLRQ